VIQSPVHVEFLIHFAICVSDRFLSSLTSNSRLVTEISGNIVSVHDQLRVAREIPVDTFLSAWRMQRNLTILILR
jgi:hypothetical protein